MEDLYLARQPIININRKIIGYELLFRDTEKGIKHMPSNAAATSKVLYNALNFMDLDDIIGESQKAFLNCDHAVLAAGFLDLLDPDKFVIELLETTIVDEHLIRRIHKLHSKGFTFAIDDFDCTKEMLSKFKPILKYISIIKVCLNEIDLTKHIVCLGTIQGLGKTMLAEKVETREQFESCLKLGFTLFQGYFFHKPEVLTSTSYSDITKVMILKLIADIKKDSDIEDLIKSIRAYPDLTLMLMNFAGNKIPQTKISSVRQMIQLIGRNDLTRWCLMYLQVELKGIGLSENLIALATTRAEACEHAAVGPQKDMAYLVGLISALGTIFEADVEDLLHGIKLCDEVKNAIVFQTGDLGESLKEVVKAEREKLMSLLLLNKTLVSSDQIVKILEELGLEY